MKVACLIQRSVVSLVIALLFSGVAAAEQSIARQWNEELLDAIRIDFARPTVHARNLFHVSAAVWDAWAAYDRVAGTYLHHERAWQSTSDPGDVRLARAETISYAAYRILSSRFATSPGADRSLPTFDAKMDELGYDRGFTSTLGDSPAALGNRIAQTVLEFGAKDNANEAGGYANLHYEPINPPLLPALPGNPDIVDPNRWQPLVLDFFVDQAGNPFFDGVPEFLSPEWGQVDPFALSPSDLTVYRRDGFDYWVYHDPGPPPMLDGPEEEYYKWGFEMVLVWSSHLDPEDGVMIDISPGTIGNSPLPDPADYAAYYDFFNGGDSGRGHPANPVTGKAYEPQLVPRGDYARVPAEFWADGPDSETPPGHWFTIANYVSDHPLTVKRIGGRGPTLDDLEWDVKVYLTLGGAMHDCAIAAWGAKGWYDYVRPVSATRYMGDLGQATCFFCEFQPSYHSNGLRLYPDYIEVVTEESAGAAGRHSNLDPGDAGKMAALA